MLRICELGNGALNLAAAQHLTDRRQTALAAWNTARQWEFTGAKRASCLYGRLLI